MQILSLFCPNGECTDENYGSIDECKNCPFLLNMYPTSLATAQSISTRFGWSSAGAFWRNGLLRCDTEFCVEWVGSIMYVRTDSWLAPCFAQSGGLRHSGNCFELTLRVTRNFESLGDSPSHSRVSGAIMSVCWEYGNGISDWLCGYSLVDWRTFVPVRRPSRTFGLSNSWRKHAARSVCTAKRAHEFSLISRCKWAACPDVSNSLAA